MLHLVTQIANEETNTQDPRLAEAGRALRVPVSQPLLQQHHPEQGAQAHGQAASGELQGGGPTASGQPALMFHHLLQREPPVFQFQEWLQTFTNLNLPLCWNLLPDE